MKTEIETRFLEIDKDVLISKLRGFGAQDLGEVKLDEVIFHDRDNKWLEENKLVKLRQNGSKIKLIFKCNKEKTVDGSKEIEFEVSDFLEAKAFLEATGLVPWRIVEKYRHTFKLDNVVIDIDTWPKIPVYAELEGDSVEELKLAAQKLELVWEDRFDGDPRFVYKKYGFDFDNIRTVTFDKFE